MYDRAQLFRTQKNADGAAAAFAKLAAPVPADEPVQCRLLAAESLIQDKEEGFSRRAGGTLERDAGARETTGRPPMRTRYETDRADAFVGTGQTDSARTILTALAARFPTSKRIQDKLAKLK